MPSRSILHTVLALLCAGTLLKPADASARRLTLRAEEMRTPVATFSGVAVAIDDVDAAATLHIDAGHADIPALRLAGRLAWTCALTRIDAATRECAGPLTLASTATDATAAQLRARVDKTSLTLAIRRDEHTATVTLPIAGEAPLTFSLRDVPLSWARPSLAAAWPAGRIDNGTIDADGDYAGDGRAGIDFDVRDADFASNDGSVSGADLSLRGHLDTGLRDGARSIAGNAAIASGRFSLGDFVADPAGDVPVSMTFAASGRDGLWDLSDFSWRDDAALAFTANGTFDTNALAPLRHFAAHIERAAFPRVAERYGTALWAVQGLARIALAGHVSGDVEVDVHGVQSIALATQRFDIDDPARRISLRGVHGGIDWARRGERPPLELGWKTARLADVVIPAASARWQSRSGAMHLRDALGLKVFGGRLKLTRLQFEPLDPAAGLRSDFALDQVGYDAPDGAFALSKLGARGKLSLSLHDDVPRLQVDAALTRGELLAGTVYIKLPEQPVKLALDVAGSGSDWRVSRFAWHDEGVVDVTAQGTLALNAAKPVQALEIELREAQLRPLLDRYARSWLASKHYADLSASGSVSGSLRLDSGGLHDLHVNARSAGIHDGSGRFSFDDVDGDFVWSAGADAAPAQVRWQSIEILKLPLGAGQATLTTRDGVIGLDDPLSVDVLGGKIRLEKLRIEPRSPQGERYAASFAIAGLEMAQVSAAFGWPRFPGNLSGGIPEIELIGDKLVLRGGLDFYVFDGHVGVSGLELQRPFGFSPTLGANVHFENLELEQLTQAFSFGGMSGRLDGSIADLKLVDWSPVAFDASLHTVAGGRMSYKAVADVTSIGGGGGLSTNMQTIALKFVNTFGYGRLGIRCRLADGVCAMAGIDPLPPATATDAAVAAGYTIVEGAGIPRINIVGHRRRVDWPTLVRRLVEATQGQGPVIN